MRQTQLILTFEYNMFKMLLSFNVGHNTILSLFCSLVFSLYMDFNYYLGVVNKLHPESPDLITQC